ncbi:PQQ-binding-like beta-propeller repeat protein [Streptomyces sp. NPDC048106]|uniref:outer membrane protein assembly factor BamB family protein n=1 Tax=Streptomyces sp. NPDC048106 TaxID=3155750 RepID=UPI003451928F
MRKVREALLDRAFFPGEGWRANNRRFGWILDCREIEMAADVMPAVSRLLYELIAPFAPQAVVGTGLSGAPLVGALVLESARRAHPMDGLVLRDQRKAYGRRRQLEGPIPPAGSDVAIVDDLESSGATAGWIIETATQYGLRPIVVVTLVRFDNHARDSSAHDEIPRRYLFTLSDLGIACAPENVSAPPVTWRVNGVNIPDDVPFSRPVHARGLIVLGSNQGQLLAVDLSGAERWRTPLGDPRDPSPTHCTPVITADGLIIGSDDGVVRCVDCDTGRLRWMTPCADRVGAGLVDDGRGHVLVPATRLPHEGAVLSVRTRDGRIAWRRPLAGYAHSRPAVVASTAVAADNSGTVTAFGTTGEQQEPLWRVMLGAPVKADLVVDDTDSCYCADFHGWLTALALADGGIRWRRRLGGCLYAVPAVADDRLYVAGDGHVFALERRSGRVDWVAPVGSRAARGAIAQLTDGTIAVGCGDGSVRFFSAAGRLQSLLQTGGAVTSGVTAIGGRRAVVASADGCLYFLDPLIGQRGSAARVGKEQSAP